MSKRPEDHTQKEVVVSDLNSGGVALRALLHEANAGGARVVVAEDIRNERRRRPLRLDDLYRRARLESDQTLLRELVRGHTVLVTGAGGSIGAELCRQAVRHGAQSLVM